MQLGRVKGLEADPLMPRPALCPVAALDSGQRDQSPRLEWGRSGESRPSSASWAWGCWSHPRLRKATRRLR